MAVPGEAQSGPDGSEPPFLAEPTEVVEAVPESPPIGEQVTEHLYRWRFGLAALAVPVVLTALAAVFFNLAEGDSGSETQVIAGPEAAVEAIAGKVERADETTEPAPGDDPGEADGPLTPPLPVPSPDASSSTTATTEPATTSTEPTTTNEPTTTTTEATTTVTPAPSCLVTLRRRADLHAQPDDDSERLSRVERGLYAGLDHVDADDGWYQIQAFGMVGWVEARRVGEVEGDCGG